MADGKPIVYLDMDGVLADFFGGVEKLYGVSHWKELTADKTKDLKKEVIDRITGTDFFATLPKFPTADTLIDMVKTFTGGTFSINTSPLRGDHENSGKYKKVWISNNIETPAEIIVTGRKETYAKDKASGTPNILTHARTHVPRHTFEFLSTLSRRNQLPGRFCIRTRTSYRRLG